jgi:2-C-methyl-D-erythritol 4-phosphate cytidylyltransferase / 2-C-methyl-D-erythritol 2,4-cyclodiphosphate synthase
MQVTAVIAAGGRGVRFGGGLLKQLQRVGGRTILDRSIQAFAAHPAIAEVIVAVPPELVADLPLDAENQRSIPVRIVAGGARRQDSVANAVQEAAAASDVIVIHDAARPFVSADLISRTIDAAVAHGAALAATPSRDTVKRVDGSAVIETLPREVIYLAQTPQAFRRDVLDRALRAAGAGPGRIEATDEASLIERLGERVEIVEGEASNIKITTPEDLVLAEAIAARSAEAAGMTEREGFGRARPARTGRAGTGYDLHRLVPGRPLILGGVTIPAERGALGHSDADVVCHAITDAILGAARLGDIGRHFPDTDPAWKGASSLDMLARATAMVARAGFEVGNVDVTIVLESPKIKPYIDAMQTAVARAIGIDPDRVSVKGKTNEGVDAVGRGEAIAAHAIALLRRA